MRGLLPVVPVGRFTGREPLARAKPPLPRAAGATRGLGDRGRGSSFIPSITSDTKEEKYSVASSSFSTKSGGFGNKNNYIPVPSITLYLLGREKTNVKSHLHALRIAITIANVIMAERAFSHSEIQLVLL